MKNIFLLFLFNIVTVLFLNAQHSNPTDSQRKSIASLIDEYSEAREKSDTALLKTILTTDIDQLVSTGEWRNGINAAVQGMLKSSAGNPGSRTLRIENIRMINRGSAIVDCRYDIQNPDGTTRKMWSTFIVILEEKKWKISAIRNMMPTS